jgi:S1-C subfamily serine protease
VVAATTAEGAGGDALQPGDVIYSLNANAVAGIERLRAALEGVKPGDPLVLQIQRGAELRYVTVPPE